MARGEKNGVQFNLLALKKNNSKPVTAEIFGETVSISRHISLEARVAIANLVVSSCFVEGVYYSPIFDFAFRLGILMNQTNIEIPEAEEDQKFLALHSGVYEKVCESINPDELYETNKACEEQVALALRKDQHSFDDLFDLIENTLNDIKQSFDEDALQMILRSLPGLNPDPTSLAHAVISYDELKKDG